jgi:NAD(P)-dependent dehydrogenase (short-subunit alcohol dehydrogenase family)
MSVFSSLYGAGSVILSKAFVTLPIPNGYPGLSDQTFIVTGANTGLGFESSLHLSRLGVRKLIMAVRTQAKGEDAKNKILKSTSQPKSSIEVWQVDMDNQASVKAFAARASSELSRLDGVLANAGIMTSAYESSESNERTLNINVINTFLLYLLLLPKMRESERQTGQVSRFTIPNSALHYSAPVAELDPKGHSIFERLNDAKKADMEGRYSVSKLLVIYAVRELADRTRTSGKGATIINTPNPSFCKSGLAHEFDSQAFKVFEKVMARTTEEGSRVLVHGVLAGKETNGQYLANCCVEM